MGPGAFCPLASTRFVATHEARTASGRVRSRIFGRGGGRSPARQRPPRHSITATARRQRSTVKVDDVVAVAPSAVDTVTRIR